jgi:hypothetical protein
VSRGLVAAQIDRSTHASTVVPEFHFLVGDNRWHDDVGALEQAVPKSQLVQADDRPCIKKE